jgi:hypothetical protein
LAILLGFICEFSYFSLGLVIKTQGVQVLLGLGISHPFNIDVSFQFNGEEEQVV